MQLGWTMKYCSDYERLVKRKIWNDCDIKLKRGYNCRAKMEHIIKYIIS